MLGLNDSCSASHGCSSQRQIHGIRRLPDQVPSFAMPQVPTRTNAIQFLSYLSTSTDWKAKYNEVADMLAETRAELDEFHTSSKELEEELIKEIDRTERAQQDLKVKVSRTETERDEWKVRFRPNGRSNGLIKHCCSPNSCLFKPLITPPLHPFNVN